MPFYEYGEDVWRVLDAMEASERMLSAMTRLADMLEESERMARLADAMERTYSLPATLRITAATHVASRPVAMPEPATAASLINSSIIACLQANAFCDLGALSPSPWL